MARAKTGKNNPIYGTKISQQHKDKISNANKRKIVRSDGLIFNSLQDAAAHMKCLYQSISQSLRKGCRCKGYTFRYSKGAKNDID